MAKRKPKSQSEHDLKVRQAAKDLKRKGWDVKADISGFQQPEPIGKGNYIPDLTAKKGGAEKVIEVETKETMKRDKKQHAAFRRSAAQKKRTSFTIEEV